MAKGAHQSPLPVGLGRIGIENLTGRRGSHPALARRIHVHRQPVAIVQCTPCHIGPNNVGLTQACRDHALINGARCSAIGSPAADSQQTLAIVRQLKVSPVVARQIQGGPCPTICGQLAQITRRIAIAPQGNPKKSPIAVPLRPRTISQNDTAFVGDQHIGVVIRRGLNPRPGAARVA